MSRTTLRLHTAAWLLFAGLPASAQPVMTVLAELGTPAPGAPFGAVFTRFLDAPAIDADGAVLFGAQAGPHDGLWTFANGTLAPVALATQPAPGTEACFSQFSFGSLTFTGAATAFESILSAPAQSNESLWSFASDSPRLLGREGDPAPGLGTGVNHGGFQVFFNHRTNALGHTAFYSRLSGPMVNGATAAALFMQDTSGAVQPVFRAGDQAPLLPSGPTFAPIDEITGTLALADSGALAFPAPLTGPSIGADNNTALFYRAPGGNTRPLLIEGGSAPGLEPGVGVGHIFLPPSMDHLGGLACITGLAGPAVTPERSSALWIAPVGLEIAPAVFAGDQAPDTRAGIVFSNFSGLNRSGTLTAFSASLAGPGVTAANNTGLWLFSDAGPLTRLARTGDPLPGATGVTIASLVRPSLTPQGLVVFQVTLAGAGVSSANDKALCYALPGQPVRLLLREGDPITLHGSDPAPRPVLSFGFRFASGGQDGLATGLSPQGLAALRIDFSDGTGAIALVDLLPCPADVNNDGIVSPADFSAWVAAFNAAAPGCDQNGDSLCTAADFSAWVANFNAGCP